MLNKYFYRKVTINYSNLRASSRPSRSSRLIFKATIIQKNDIIKQLMESYLAKEMLKSRQERREKAYLCTPAFLFLESRFLC